MGLRRSGAHLTTQLHLAYLLSHVYNRGGNMDPNWDRFYDCVATLGAKKKAVARTVGIEEQLLMRWAHDPAAPRRTAPVQSVTSASASATHIS